MKYVARIGLMCVLMVSLAGCTAGAVMVADGANGGGDTIGGSTMTMSATEMQRAMDTLTAINAHRKGKGLDALTWYQAGADVAFAHCLAMEAGDFFEHVDPNTNTDPATRALNAGITHDAGGFFDPTSGNPFVGENLFMASGGDPTGQEAVDSWITSPGHHTQIDAPLPVTGAQTMPAWTHCGIGVRLGNGDAWWTAMFYRNPN